MREQRLRDAKVCGSLFLADTLFLAQQCQNARKITVHKSFTT